MKECTYCGKTYADETKVCPLDQQPLQRVGAAPGTPTEDDPSATMEARDVNSAAQTAANRDLMVGGLWCFGGILVTAMTYSAASSSRSGGTYFVAWGAILFGGIQFVRGLMAKMRL